MDTEDTFAIRIRRTAHLLAYKQDTSSFDPFEVAAARMYLKDQEPSESALTTDLDVGSPEPFCACGRRISQCDRSRKSCKGT